MFDGLQETLTEVTVDGEPPPPEGFGPTQPASNDDKIPMTTSQTGQSLGFLNTKVRTEVTITASPQ